MTSKETSKSPTTSLFSNSRLLEVGIIHPSYGYERVTYALPLIGIKYSLVKTLPLHRIMGATNTFYQFTPVALDFFGVDLLHTWNSLPIGSKPFIVSFECELPRYLGDISKDKRAFGIKLLQSKRCRKILALSQAAKNQFITKCVEAGHSELIKKVEVFRGGVALPISRKTQYNKTGPLRLLFVGTDAIRKGFIPLLKSISDLIANGMDIELTIIGGFNANCYVYKSLLPDIESIKNNLQNMPWVKFLGKVPSLQVFEEMVKNDVLLFPTFDESLGWVPIEAGLLGVPTIATNIFALPELIEHKKTGYLISIQKGVNGRFTGLDTSGDELKSRINQASIAIENGLKEAISLLYEDRQKIEDWGLAAREKLYAMYDEDNASKRLQSIYVESM